MSLLTQLKSMDNFTQEQRLEELEKKMEELYNLKEVLTSSPSYNPTNFNEQFAFYDGALYTNINNVWTKIGGGNYYMGYTEISSTGNQSVTGVGFKPKLVTMRASNTNTLCIGSMDGTNDYSTVQWFDSSNALAGIQTNSYAINLKDTGGTNTFVANFSSFDNDGFTLNVTTASVTAYIVFEAYG